MVRVAGTDPGTSSLDVVMLENGRVVGERRFEPVELQTDPSGVVRFLEANGPFDLIAGPSGYGIPLKPAGLITDTDLNLMTLVRPDEQRQNQGVLGFRRLLRELCNSRLPVVFLPAVIHLSSVPAHRKFNRIDMGTADKLCVAALAVSEHSSRLNVPYTECDLCVVELGSAFSAVLVVLGGRVVDGLGGTSGPLGWRSGGAWDGELAYLLGPLSKQDMFDGGVCSIATADGDEVKPESRAVRAFIESTRRTVAAARSVNRFSHVAVSGRLLEIPWMKQLVREQLSPLGDVHFLEGLPNTAMKRAAQGAALIADGLAGGELQPIVDQLGIRNACGTVFDWLNYSRAVSLRAAFGL